MRKLIEGSQRKVSLWAGGSSSQIAIWPEDADYAARNFLYRISTAIADSDEWSDYTSLPGVTRHLLMLDGTAELIHEGHYDVLMKSYEPVETFDGGWKSRAKGKVRDFNLMCKDGCKGRMTVGIPELEAAVSHRLIFCADGEAELHFADEVVHLGREDALLLIPAESCEVKGEGKIVCCDMWL